MEVETKARSSLFATATYEDKPSTKIPEEVYKDANIDRVRRKAKSVLRTIPNKYEDEEERPPHHSLTKNNSI